MHFLDSDRCSFWYFSTPFTDNPADGCISGIFIIACHLWPCWYIRVERLEETFPMVSLPGTCHKTTQETLMKYSTSGPVWTYHTSNSVDVFFISWAHVSAYLVVWPWYDGSTVESILKMGLVQSWWWRLSTYFWCGILEWLNSYYLTWIRINYWRNRLKQTANQVFHLEMKVSVIHSASVPSEIPTNLLLLVSSHISSEPKIKLCIEFGNDNLQV